MKNNNDQIYIDQIKAGDTSAYTYIVEKYKNMAFTIALKIIGDSVEAQDVAQESFLKAYQQIHSFEGRAKFSTWLYTIVYRTALNQVKKRRGRNFSIEDLDESQIIDSATPQLEHLQLEQQHYVKKAIGKLPPTEALLITLFYMNENSIKEIEVITGLSSANIKIKLFRARKKLKLDLAFLI